MKGVNFFRFGFFHCAHLHPCGFSSANAIISGAKYNLNMRQVNRSAIVTEWITHFERAEAILCENSFIRITLIRGIKRRGKQKKLRAKLAKSLRLESARYMSKGQLNSKFRV